MQISFIVYLKKQLKNSKLNKKITEDTYYIQRERRIMSLNYLELKTIKFC